jgi:hypothetical protein
MRAAEALIDEIISSSRIPSVKRRRDVARELRGHVEDLVLSARAAGHGDHEIEKMVLARLGDPVQIAHNFAWVYRRDRAILATSVFGLSTLMVAAITAVGILLTQAAIASSLGAPVRNVLASRHTIIEGADILSTVAVYLGIVSLENRLGSFWKAILVSAAVFGALAGLAAGIRVHAPFLIFGFAAAFFLVTARMILKNPVVRFGLVPACFGIAGMLLWVRSGFQYPAGSTLASWIVMGVGYQAMTGLASRVDRRLFHALQQF